MKSKGTYQIDAQLVASVREAVENGAANSMSEFAQDVRETTAAFDTTPLTMPCTW